MKRTIGIVPARGGSKRIPRKNVVDLGGKPLVARALETALTARTLGAVVLTSDDDEALAVGASIPGVICLRRPPEISTDTAPAIDYVRHVLAALGERGDHAADAVAIVQPTSPFTVASDIDAVVELLFSSGADSAVSIMQVDHAVHPLKLKALDGDRLLPLIEDERGRMAEHEMPKVYVRNGSVYASRAQTIEGGSLLGGDSRGFLMPRERSIDINDPLDLEFARFLVGRST